MIGINNIYARLRDILYTRHIYELIIARSNCCQTADYSKNTSAIERQIESLIACTKKGGRCSIDDVKPLKITSPSLIEQTGKGSRITLVRLMFQECAIHGNEDITCLEVDAITAGIAAIVESIHNLSLIVDDCIDEDKIRRGKPTVYALGGVEGVLIATRSILNTIFCLLDGMPLSNDVKAACADIIEHEAISLCDAIRDEVFWQTHNFEIQWNNIKKGEIIRIYEIKAAGISVIGAHLLSKCLPVNKEKLDLIVGIVNRLGVYLQRVNDIENISYIKSCGSCNADRLSDVEKRRVVLLNLNDAIANKRDLCALRTAAYRHQRDTSAKNAYIDRLVSEGVVDAEVEALRSEIQEILSEIDGLKDLSANTRFLFGYVFKKYSEPLSKYRYGAGQ